MSSNGNDLGLAACTAIVVGNMVGASFFLSPSILARYGNLGIVSWVIMGAGAICLGLTFAKLARLAPLTGGPYAFTRLAYGDFAGFLIAWGYWISIWASLPVIAIAFAGTVMDLFPVLQSRSIAMVLTLGAIWSIVLLNLRGVKISGLFSEITTYLKLVPFVAIALVGLFYIDRANFLPFDATKTPLGSAIATLAPVTMFAFLGLESATVPAGSVRNPSKTIPRATVLGIGIAALFYVFGTIAVMGIVPNSVLLHSVAPFSDAARIMWGPWGATMVSIAIIVSAIGALNGWTLLVGQVPMAAARDNLFPPIFGKVSGRGVPAIGIVVSASLSTLLVLVQAAGTPSFSAFYNSVLGLSTMTAVVPYAFCALAPALIVTRTSNGQTVPRVTAIELVAFCFAVFALYGCGAQSVLFGFLLLIFGIPVYVWQRRRLPEAPTVSN